MMLPARVLLVILVIQRGRAVEDAIFGVDGATWETTSDGGSTTVEQTANQDGVTVDGDNEGKVIPVRPTRNAPYPVMYEESADDTAPYSIPTYDLRVNPHLYACQSTLILEPFPPLTDPLQEYIIPAVRIGRCNGCNCGSYRSCQPTDQEPIMFQVEVKHYKAKNKRGTVVTTLEEVTLYNHTACRCMCKSQCSPPRILNPDTCTCVCAQKVTCQRYFTWSPARCACQCNVKQVPCPRPKVVDPETCQCRDRTEADGNGNRAQQKKKPTEVDDVNSPSVARDDVISY